MSAGGQQKLQNLSRAFHVVAVLVKLSRNCAFCLQRMSHFPDLAVICDKENNIQVSTKSSAERVFHTQE